MSSTKAFVSIVVVIGALGIGAAASALGGADGDPVLQDTTTITTTTTTTADEPTTSEVTTTLPTTTSEPPVAEEPVDTEAPTTTVAPEVAANAFGQCTAFAGRPRPGNSQAYQRLLDAAGGDIEGYCAQVFAARGQHTEVDDSEVDDPDVDDGVDEPVEQPSGERRTDRSGNNGGGNGGSNGGGRR